MLLFALVFLLFPGAIEASFTVEPTDVTVIQGDTAILKCTVVNPENSVLSWLYWSKGNQHLSINETILPNMGADVIARYSISGNRSVGDYYLQISEAKTIDQGQYHCSYISSIGGETSVSATLTVLVPPDLGFPKCSMHASSEGGSDISTIWPGQGVVFSCISRGGDPPAQLTWHRGNRNHSIMDPRPSRATYERIMKREDNGITFTCMASSPALLTPRVCSLMPMKIPPVVQVRSMTGQIKIGGNGTYHCEGSAIPRVHSYTWYGFANDKPIEDNGRFTLTNHNQVLTIHDVDYAENRMALRCEVSINSGLKASASIKLDVAEPPKPKTTTAPPPVTKKANLEEPDSHVITDIRRIITMDVNFVVAMIAGSLVLLLLVVTMIMGCWVCSATSHQPHRRSNNCSRIEYTEAVPTTIPQSYSMDGLNTKGHVLYGDTSCGVPGCALENENAPGYISALYATLDKNKRPVRTSAAVNIPGKPIAQITPSQPCDAAGEPSCCVNMVKPEKAIPEPVKVSPLVGKVNAVEPVKPVVKPPAEVVKPVVKPVVKSPPEVVKPVVKSVPKPVPPPVVPPVVRPLPVRPTAAGTPIYSTQTSSSAKPVQRPAKTKDTKPDESSSAREDSSCKEDTDTKNTNNTNFDEELD